MVLSLQGLAAGLCDQYQFPDGLPGLDPSWSRLVAVPDLDGVERTFHVLDNAVTAPSLTLLCVHGNPSWSYLWRDLLAHPPAGARVVAVDHLDLAAHLEDGLAQAVDAVRQRLHVFAAVDAGAFGVR